MTSEIIKHYLKILDIFQILQAINNFANKNLQIYFYKE